jgi:transcriptional regulator with XRE-family HTH domain
MKIISKRLKALRESVGLSQNKLGKLVGLPQSSINRYEQAQSAPSPATLRWYADHFDVSMDYIYGRTDDPHGAHYEYKPTLKAVDPEMAKFVEMCFDPGSRMNERLKETLIQMLSEEVDSQ